jgi:PAS domain S-box-containing protein
MDPASFFNVHASAVVWIALGTLVLGAAALAELLRRARSSQPEWAFEASPDATFVADSARVLLEANAALCDAVGRERADVVGRTIEDIFGTSAEEASFAWERLTRDGELRGTWCFAAPDGGDAMYDIAAVADIEPGRHIASLREVTNERQLERQLRQAEKMQALRRLAAGVAHHVNDAVQAIGGYGQFALMHLDEGGEATHDVEQMMRAADRAAHLSHQLLTFSRSRPLDEHVLSLNDIVHETEALIRRTIGDDIRVVSSLGAGLGTIRGDQAALGQVVLDLAQNARDAMPSGGVLTMETANVDVTDEDADLIGLEPGSFVLLAVADTGIGMDEETLAQAFEPFFTTKTGSAGTGLGLATVYGVVTQSGGRVTVASEPGAGTTVRIYLPHVSEPVEPRLMPNHVPVEGGSEHVLLVDDDETVRDLVASMLSEHGYRIVTAPDPLAAIAHADEERFDVLVTDVVMPKLNGRELATKLRERDPDLRVVYMSGHPAGMLPGDLLEDEMSVFLQKPFKMLELARAIRSALEPPRTTAR